MNREWRIRLRRWHPGDRGPFAAMNADPRVMEFFPSGLTRAQSDGLVDQIEGHFEEHGFGLWAVEVPGVADFIGFTGLSVPNFQAPFTPCVEIGWRIAREFWGRGYATEAAQAALQYGFEDAELSEIVSFTAVGNVRSQRVMERIGLRRDPADDFLHPRLPPGHPLAAHVLYRMNRNTWLQSP